MRGNSYSFSQDINGNFVVQNFNVSDSSIEADYAWVYFSLSAPSFNDHEIYINGMFNNYSLTLEFKMDYNPKNFTKKAILIKQGFTNFEYVVVTIKEQSIRKRSRW
jgi:hypothetical protein